MKPRSNESAQLARPVTRSSQLRGSISITFGGVPRLWVSPSTHWTATYGGTLSSTAPPGAIAARYRALVRTAVAMTALSLSALPVSHSITGARLARTVVMSGFARVPTTLVCPLGGSACADLQQTLSPSLASAAGETCNFLGMSSAHDDQLLAIGTFGRHSGLSVKALRHYDRLGLLPAAYVDAATGYRWYEPAQVSTARLISRLRALDLPLQLIRECVEPGNGPEIIIDLLRTHRTRLEARLERIRGDLHTIDHYLSDGMDLGMTSAINDPIDLGDERKLAVNLFNSVWDLMGLESRSTAQDDQLVHAAHASVYHWSRVGQPVNLARGEWQCSRVYAVLGRSEPSLHHAQRCLDLCTENGIGDWDIAFAYEGLARGHAVGGDAESARTYTDQALAAAEHIADAEDRQLVMSDLESIPGQPRYW